MAIDRQVYLDLMPNVERLIQFYYQAAPENAVGGRLHSILDDGNLDDDNLYQGQQACELVDDWLGYLICTLLRYYDEEERDEMHGRLWGMR